MRERIANYCRKVHFCTAEHPYVVNGLCDCIFGQPSDNSKMSLCRHFVAECGEYVNLCRSEDAQEDPADYYSRYRASEIHKKPLIV